MPSHFPVVPVQVGTLLLFWVITARKRSLRRLCFHRCFSVDVGSAPLHAGIHSPPLGPETDPPPEPEADTPLGRPPPGKHPQADTDTPPVQAGIRSTSGRYASHWNEFLLC